MPSGDCGSTPGRIRVIPMRIRMPAALLVLLPGTAGAVDFNAAGYADFRLIVPSNQVSWQDGGLGTLRFGAENARPDLKFAEAAIEGSAVILPELLGVATIRAGYKQHTAVDILEGYLRYRPVSTSPW